MGFYARPSWRLFGQVTADVFVLGWGVAWWSAGRFVDATLLALANPARETARVTGELRRQVAEAAEQAGNIPFVGDDLRRPLDGMNGNLDRLAASADDLVGGVERTALVLGWLTFVVPVALMLVIWLPRRVRFAARARATRALVEAGNGTDLLALRALATQPLGELRAVASDPVAAWRAGDADVTARLAELELVRAGVVSPQRPAPR